MKNKIAISILILISISKLNGQIFSKSPRNINNALEILDKELSSETKSRITNTAKDSLFHFYFHSANEFNDMDNWFFRTTRKSYSKKTRFNRYYLKKGLIIPNDMIKVILFCYQSKLRGLPIEHDKTLLPFQIRQQKHNKEDKIRYTTDTLRGIYIPLNLEDCFTTLDKMYSDSVKIEITKLSEEEYSSGNHLFGIGRWMRNNWHLWGGSRLTKSFNKLGIYHSESMSGIIMDSYHRYLRKEGIKLKEQIKSDQEYWEKIKKHGG
jgi:hypothetical protein